MKPLNNLLAISFLVLAVLACTKATDQTPGPSLPTQMPAKTSIVPTPSNKKSVYVVAVDVLEIRAGNGTSYRNVGYLKKGDPVPSILEKPDENGGRDCSVWVEIQQGSRDQNIPDHWVCKDGLTFP